MKSYTEYSVITGEDEINCDTLEEAQDYFNDLPKEEQLTCQFFSKTWNFINNDWQEGEVQLLDKNLD